MMQELKARDLRIISRKVRRAHVDDSREETSYACAFLIKPLYSKAHPNCPEHFFNIAINRSVSACTMIYSYKR